MYTCDVTTAYREESMYVYRGYHYSLQGGITMCTCDVATAYREESLYVYW